MQPEVIESRTPVNAIRKKKKGSSIVVGMKLVKKGEADAFVSAKEAPGRYWSEGRRW